MNERIKELAVAVGFKILSDGRIIPTLDHNGECGRDLEKFAHLIVKECSEVMRLVPYNSDRNFGEEYVYQDAIENHFGVE